MTNIKQKITVIATSAILLLNTFSGIALADTSLEISGNGAKSDNSVDVSSNNNSTVVQDNNATVHNDVNTSVSTGGNKANDNTGGDVVISTGDAKSSVDLSTKVNLNSAQIDNCGCNSDSKVNIDGNGAKSDNYVSVDNSTDNSIYQTNKANISNNVDSYANTGYNDANRNTGGDVVVSTGNAISKTEIDNKANANVANIGGSSSSDGKSGSSNLSIWGNGAESDNKIDLNSNKSNVVVQDNSAKIHNNVDSYAKTGGNNANDNTGGDVVIDTGYAAAFTDISNLANFNAASIDCGCFTGVKANISGNGYDSYNDIKANFDKTLQAFQTNDAYLSNYVDSYAKTGENDANRNTGKVYKHVDPAIYTGDAVSKSSVYNDANVNVYGPHATMHLPSGIDLDFNFDIGSLMNAMHFG